MGGGIFAKTAKTPPLQSGVCGDFIAIRIAPKGRPLVSPCAYHAHPASPHEPVVLKRRGAPRRYKRPSPICACAPLRHRMHSWRPRFLQRRGTPRRYGLREPELPDLNHFTRNKGKAPITNKRLNPYGSFAAVSLSEYGGLNPILPFLEGRSDAACRVVIPLYAVSIDAHGA